jgi:hypothetical protein
MGKSVFLDQLRAELERVAGVRVVLIQAPPPELTVRACLDSLARVLGVAAQGALYSLEIFETFFARDGAPERLVLLFDEFDRYAESGKQESGQPPGRGFFNDLEASRRALGRLGLLAAGSIGIYVFRDVLGSSFLARALHVRLLPFGPGESADLTRAFDERGTPLPDDVLAGLQLATGGLPALLTYGLQRLWRLEGLPTPHDVTAIYAEFREEHGEYLRDLLKGLTNPRLSEAPQRVWERIQRESGEISRSVLEEACRRPDGPLDLDLADVLHLLQATGLVRLQGSAYSSDPVVAHPITSILNLPSASPPREGFRERFLNDLEMLLGKLHRSSADFFRPHPKGKRLLPEAVFTAHLGLGFDLLGWTIEREAQSVAGRTDLKLRRNGSREVAIVEVKIWGHPGAKEAQLQIESYWTAEVAAGAVVQIADAAPPEWAEVYRRECLEGSGCEVERRVLSDSPVQARWTCNTALREGMVAFVDHYLLWLGRRAP